MGKKKKGGNKGKEEKEVEEKKPAVEAGPSDLPVEKLNINKPQQQSERQHGPTSSGGRGNVWGSRESTPPGIPPQALGEPQQQQRRQRPGQQGPPPQGLQVRGPAPGQFQQAGPPPGQPQQRGPPPGLFQQAGPPPGQPQQRGPPPGQPQQRGPPPGQFQQVGPPPGQFQQAGPPPGQPQQRGPPPGQPQQRGPPPGQFQQVGPPPGQFQQAGPPPGQPQQRGPPPGQPQQRGPPPGQFQQVGPPPGQFQQAGPPPGQFQQVGPPPGQFQQAGPPPGQFQQVGPPPGQPQQRGPPPGQFQQVGPPPGQFQQAGPPPGQPQQRGPPPGQPQQRGPPPGQPQQRGPPPGQSQQREPQQAGGPPTGQKQATMELEIQDKISRSGTLGRRIPIFTNHFELKLGNVKKVIHYDVDIQPDTPKKLLKVAFQYFRHAHFPNNNPAFDGRKNAYSAKRLPFGSAVSGKVVVEEEGVRSKEFTIKMQEVNVVDLESISVYLKQAIGNRIIEIPMDALQAIDIVFRHSLMMQKITVGRSFFSRPIGQSIDLGNGMEMYKGLFQAVSLGWKPYLNIDVANKAFPKSQSVVDLIKELCPRHDIRTALYDRDAEVVTKFIKGLRVEYNLPNKPTTKKRTRVNGTGPPADKNYFDYTNENGQIQNVTVAQYFQMVYGIRLQYPQLPCLWVGSMQKVQRTYLPSEFCTILPGQAVQRKLDANQTRTMIRNCATSTDVRKNSIKTLLNDAKYNSDATVKEFDLNVSDDFLKLDARVLIPPNLRYKKQVVQVKKGVWNATHFFDGKDLQNWTILNLDGRTKPDSLNKLASMLYNGSRNLGMQMSEATPPFEAIQTYRNNRLHDDLKRYFQSKSNMQIIFVVIPDTDKTYNFVKQAAELAVGSLTQCIKAGTVYSKLNAATIGNILLKVNAKLNGANHVLDKTPKIMLKATMIMGADVTHPSPDATSIPSVAAVTASHDSKAFKYNICWRLQPPTEEVIADMENITMEQLRYFRKMTNAVPQSIIFYRDGVSDGQFTHVLKCELMAIRRACSKLSPTYKPSITFIVVQKRHHTRFFPANPRDSEDRNCNVPAGTCVDTQIVHPTRQNFFLVSHASIQGVAKPTKYVTLWDDNDFSNDDLQALTYELCHMFARCTRSVSYPAPTYYAHLAAARAKVYIETMQLNMNDLAREQERIRIKDEIVKQMPMFFV